MKGSDWIFAIEFGAGFVLLLLLAWWQFRVMDKEEAAEAKRKEQEERERENRKIY